MIRIWFNHWFSTSYHIIQLLKEGDPDYFFVIGSNQRYDSVIQNVCDEWFEEPVLDGEEYLEFCIDFCKKQAIDIFIPRRKMVEISEHIERFSEIGVKVMVDDMCFLSLLNDKAKAYQWFQKNPHIHVPEFFVVNNVMDFQKAYEKLKERHEKICMKFVRDEGGMSFRVIEDEIDHFLALTVYPGRRIAYSSLFETLKARDSFQDLLIMPYLSGNEISVDCLNTKDGLIAIPRFKGPSRAERVEFRDEILFMCEELLKSIPLKHPCNIQFKLSDEIPYLLEVNTRMSGGIQLSCLSTGVNIPNIAVNKLLGIEKKWSIDRSPKMVSYIEVPQFIGC